MLFCGEYALREGSTSTTGKIARDFRNEMLTIDDIAVPDNTASAVDTRSQRLDPESSLSGPRIILKRGQQPDLPSSKVRLVKER
jgi:hypothetical protein